MDPTTGKIDMDIINTGISNTSKERIRQIMNIVKRAHTEFKDKRGMTIKYHNLFEYVTTKHKEGVNV